MKKVLILSVFVIIHTKLEYTHGYVCNKTI